MAIPNPQDLPERVSRLEILMELIRQKLESLENWMREIHHEMTEKFNKIDDMFERVDGKFSQLRRDIDRKFTWMVGTGFFRLDFFNDRHCF